MTKKDWVKTGDAISALQISRKALFNIKSDLKKGYHYRIVSRKDALRATYQWHLSRLDKYLTD